MNIQAQSTNEFIFPANVLRVVDGDTLFVELNKGGGDFYRGYCRLVGVDGGIDTPERSTIAGQYVRKYVESVINQSERTQIQMVGFGKFAGRFLGRVLLVNYGHQRDLCACLLEDGLGREYNGGKRPPWNDDELEAIESRLQSSLGIQSAMPSLAEEDVKMIGELDSIQADSSPWALNEY